MELVDTHAHLYLDHFEKDRDEVVLRALHEGVNKIILPNIDSKSISPLKNLCNSYQINCYPLMGLHPTSVKNNFEEELTVITAELENNKYFGVGEIGIDLYWDKTFLKEQIKAFRYQIDMAIKHELPVVIHARESFNEIFNVLKDYKNKKLVGVFHAFTGTTEQVDFINENFNFYFGIGGIVTFKNSGLEKAVEKIGLEKIILETDSPYLAPVPFRGKRNESSYLIHIAKKVAEIFDTTTEKVSEIATQNSYLLFRLN